MFYESVNSRRSRLHKAPQTETHDTYLLRHPPTCTLWISMSSYGPSLSPFISEVRHSSVASPTDQLFLPQQGSLKSGSMCFLLQLCDQQSSAKEHPAAARQYFYSPLTNRQISILSSVTKLKLHACCGHLHNLEVQRLLHHEQIMFKE